MAGSLEQAIKKTVRRPWRYRVGALLVLALMGFGMFQSAPRIEDSGSKKCAAPYLVRSRSGSKLTVTSWMGGRLNCTMTVVPCHPEAYWPGRIYWSFASCGGGGGRSW
jgi:hypothetical protein